ncbi:hypothetical protein RJ640_024096, partial [Escallonia rubra]
ISATFTGRFCRLVASPIAHLGGSPSSSRPSTPSISSSSSFMLRPGDQPYSLSNVSPAEAADIVVYLKDKSVDELRKLLCDKDAYHRFLLSLDLVKTQNSTKEYVMMWKKKVKDELLYETLQLASSLTILREIMQVISVHRGKLGKRTLFSECKIIRTTELAAAREKVNELERQKQDILKLYSPASLLHRLKVGMNKTEEESETLHKQLLGGEIDVVEFVQNYKTLRNTYHKRALTQLASKTSLTGLQAPHNRT